MIHTFCITFLALIALIAVAAAPELAPDVRRLRRSVGRPGAAGARPGAVPGRHSVSAPRRSPSLLGPDPAPPWNGWGPAR
jgi:hypothetical protein